MKTITKTYRQFFPFICILLVMGFTSCTEEFTYETTSQTTHKQQLIPELLAEDENFIAMSTEIIELGNREKDIKLLRKIAENPELVESDLDAAVKALGYNSQEELLSMKDRILLYSDRLNAAYDLSDKTQNELAEIFGQAIGIYQNRVMKSKCQGDYDICKQAADGHLMMNSTACFGGSIALAVAAGPFGWLGIPAYVICETGAMMVYNAAGHECKKLITNCDR